MAPKVSFSKTAIEDVLVVESPRFTDDRGYFIELHNGPAWAEQGFAQTFVQDNLSQSSKGTLRGLHYQIDPHAQGKLVRVLAGRAFDVAVDLRRGSPSFGKWIGKELSAENGLALWVPAGFAHGFLALEDATLLHYKCTGPYAPKFERSLLYSCPELGIRWPMEPAAVSPKDAAAPPLAKADFNFVYLKS